MDTGPEWEGVTIWSLDDTHTIFEKSFVENNELCNSIVISNGAVYVVNIFYVYFIGIPVT